MLQLTIDYIRMAKQGWYLGAAAMLHWGWWLAPGNFSEANASLPPSPGDYLWYPTVYFYFNGRWWKVCLFELVWRSRMWASHFDRFYESHITVAP